MKRFQFEKSSPRTRKSRSHCPKTPVRKGMMKPVNWWDRLSVAKKPKIDPQELFQTFSWWDTEDWECAHRCINELAGKISNKRSAHIDRLAKPKHTTTINSVLTEDGNSIRPFEAWRQCRARQRSDSPKRRTVSSQRCIEPLVPSPRKNCERLDCADVVNPAKDAVRTSSATESAGDQTECTDDTEEKIYRTFSWWDATHNHRGDCPADTCITMNACRPRSQSLTSQQSSRASTIGGLCKRRERSLSPLVKKYLDVPPPGALNRLFRSFSWWNMQDATPRKPLEKTIPPYKLKRRVSFDLRNNKKHPITARGSGAGDTERSRPRRKFGPQKDIRGRPLKPPNLSKEVKAPPTEKPKTHIAKPKPGVKERTLHNQWNKMKKTVPVKTSKSEDATSTGSSRDSQGQKIRPGSPVKGATSSASKSSAGSSPHKGSAASSVRSSPKRTSSEPSVKDHADTLSITSQGETQPTYADSDASGTTETTGDGARSSDGTDKFATDAGSRHGSDATNRKSYSPDRAHPPSTDEFFAGMKSPGSTGSKGRTGSAGSSGSKGRTGSARDTGSRGGAGSPKSAGSKGRTGSPRSAGSKGGTGSPVSSGSKGRTGSPRGAGSRGGAGSPGSTGSKGTRSPGSTGSKGTRSPGVIGWLGGFISPGGIGSKGGAGSPGDTGSPGGAGSSGVIESQGGIGPPGGAESKGGTGSPGISGWFGGTGSPDGTGSKGASDSPGGTLSPGKTGSQGGIGPEPDGTLIIAESQGGFGSQGGSGSFEGQDSEGGVGAFFGVVSAGGSEAYGGPGSPGETESPTDYGPEGPFEPEARPSSEYGAPGTTSGSAGSRGRQSSDYGAPGTEDGYHTGAGIVGLVPLPMSEAHRPRAGFSRLALPVLGLFSLLPLSGKTLLKIAALCGLLGLTALVFWEEIEEALGIEPEDPCGRVKDMYFCF